MRAEVVLTIYDTNGSPLLYAAAGEAIIPGEDPEQNMLVAMAKAEELHGEAWAKLGGQAKKFTAAVRAERGEKPDGPWVRGRPRG